MQNDLLKYLRERMARQLKEWMPENEVLIEKELQIFDRILSRREFLQATSLVALSTLLGGCFDHEKERFVKTPSQIEDDYLSDEDRAAIRTVGKIGFDSDILDSYTFYNPIVPPSSSDNHENFIEDEVLEALNPHITTIYGSENELLGLTNNPFKRNYGVAEIVQLKKAEGGENYRLDIVEKRYDTSQQAFRRMETELEETAGLRLKHLVAVNGSFHNFVRDYRIVSQKMVLVAENTAEENPKLLLFHQAFGTTPLFPGEDPVLTHTKWDYIDLIEQFRRYEPDFHFERYFVTDISKFEDGQHHRFLYGTIVFDDYYAYGFTVSYDSFESSEPVVQFFAPTFMSPRSDFIKEMKKEFDALDVHSLEKNGMSAFAIFKKQRFVPMGYFTKKIFSQLDIEAHETLFTFLCPDTTDNYYADIVITDDLSVGSFSNENSTALKRYAVSIDLSEKGVRYLLDGFVPPSVTFEKKSAFGKTLVSMEFKTASLGASDMRKIFEEESEKGFLPETRLWRNAFVRYTLRDDDLLYTTMVTSIYDEVGIGIVHKSVSVKAEESPSGAGTIYKIADVKSATTHLERAKEEGHDYRLWFEHMNEGSQESISDYVAEAGNRFDFYATQNSLGLLRSYFTIEIGDKRFLLHFNEKGKSYTLSDGTKIAYMEDAQLQEMIQKSDVPFYPPLPVSAHIHKLFRWRGFGEDEEVVYTAERIYRPDEKNRKLIDNEETSLHSYFVASFDAVGNDWHIHELSEEAAFDKRTQRIYPQEKHHLYFHMNNIYGKAVDTLSDSTYLEVRFDAAVVVTDHTDADRPVTYHLNRKRTLFLKPKNGMCVLEVSAGYKREDIFNGATVFYRLIDKESLELERNYAVAVVNSNVGKTTDFMRSHISFRQFGRLGLKRNNSLQAGMRIEDISGETIYQYFVRRENFEFIENDIMRLFKAFDKVYDAVKPHNDTPVTYDALTTLKPMFYASSLLEETPRLGSCCSVISKWVHKAVSTIRHSVKHVAKKVVESVSKIVRSLVGSIEEVLNDTIRALSSFVTSLIVTIERVAKMALDTMLYYIRVLWRQIRGFLGLDTALKIGNELHMLKNEQLNAPQNGGQEGNFYTLVEDATKHLEGTTEALFDRIREETNNAIDGAFAWIGEDVGKSSLSHAQSVESNRQDHSAKFHHLPLQLGRISRHMGIDSSASENMLSKDGLLCAQDATVESLLGCMLQKEFDETIKGVEKSFTDAKSLFEDILHGNGSQSVINDADALLKDIVDTIIDDAEILTEGAIQMPLAFLNGSSLLQDADKVLNDLLKDMLETIGDLLFADDKAFKTVEELSYFTLGVTVNLLLSLANDVEKALGNDTVDIVGYIKWGSFRKEMSGYRTEVSQGLLSEEGESKSFIVCQALGGVLALATPAVNAIGSNSGPIDFLLCRRVIVPVMLVTRILLYMSVLNKHWKNRSVVENSGLYIMADMLHIFVFVMQIFQQYTYGYSFLRNGAKNAVVYYGVTVVHLIVHMFESIFHLAGVLLIKEDSKKHRRQLLSKEIDTLSAVFSALSDVSSFFPNEERNIGETTFAYISLGGLVITSAASFIIANAYLVEEEIKKHS